MAMMVNDKINSDNSGEFCADSLEKLGWGNTELYFCYHHSHGSCPQ